jgi:hypothetical protein
MRVITRAVLDLETLQWVDAESFEYEGPVDLCCGSDGAEQTAQDQSQSFAKTLSTSYGSLMDQSTAAYQSASNMLQRFNQGIMNPGLSPQAMAAQETAATNAAGASARNTRQQLGNLSGGTTSSGILSGVEAQLGAAADTNASNQLASAQEGIANENANLAQQNTEFSIKTAEQQAGELGSLATGQANPAIQSNNSAFSQAQTINQQNQQFAQTLGALGVSGLENFVLPGISGGIGNLDTTGSSSVGEQFQNFFSGMGGGTTTPGAQGSAPPGYMPPASYGVG